MRNSRPRHATTSPGSLRVLVLVLASLLLVDSAISTCCGTQSSPGCDQVSTSQCVCAELPACCSSRWDLICVVQARRLCSADCSPTPPTPPPSAPTAAATRTPTPAKVTLPPTFPGTTRRPTNSPTSKSPTRLPTPLPPSTLEPTTKPPTAYPTSSPTPFPTFASFDRVCCRAQSSATSVACPSKWLRDCVCARDSYCCSAAWDTQCVHRAVQCGALSCAPTPPPSPQRQTIKTTTPLSFLAYLGGPPPLDPALQCCVADAFRKGCEDVAISRCVCQQDSFCCESHWDETCTALATMCRAPCGSDCCQAATNTLYLSSRQKATVSSDSQHQAGCSDARVTSCVCALDPYCCVVQYDKGCADTADAKCGAGCHVHEARARDWTLTHTTPPPPQTSSQRALAANAAKCLNACVCEANVYCCPANNRDKAVCKQTTTTCAMFCGVWKQDTSLDFVSCGTECVCRVDPWCCAHPWDDHCERLVQGQYCRHYCPQNDVQTVP